MSLQSKTPSRLGRRGAVTHHLVMSTAPKLGWPWYDSSSCDHPSWQLTWGWQLATGKIWAQILAAKKKTVQHTVGWKGVQTKAVPENKLLADAAGVSVERKRWSH